MSIEFTGERVIPGRVDPDLWNEHIARYEYASRFCTDLRVLDAGTGAGYGCSTLAKHARLVVGFDIAYDAVRFASTQYASPNVRWLQASLPALPFSPGAFDVVVAFEVIEHIAQWAEFVREARRVLTTGGVFLVSTPNKSFYAESRDQSGANPYHEHEFEYDEFRQALLDMFPYVTIVLQNHAQCILFDSADATKTEAHMGQSGSPLEASFYLAVCSAKPFDAASLVYVPRTANVLKERAEHIRRLQGELSTKDQWLAAAQLQHAALVALHDKQTQELKASNRWAEELDGKLKDAGHRIVALQHELDEQQRAAVHNAREYEEHLNQAQKDLETRTQWARDLEARADECRQQLARCVALLDQAEATVVERTNWALDLQRQLESLQAVVAGVKASRWTKLGRVIHLGPELPS